MGEISTQMNTYGKDSVRWVRLTLFQRLVLAMSLVAVVAIGASAAFPFPSISLAAMSMGIAVSQEANAGQAAENSFRSAGILSYETDLPDADANRICAGLKEKFVGAANTNSIIVLSGGANSRH
ncbi:hypothetical protein PY650_26645 [Rhizobium calliandrae]|uniref:Uncharacterized protein n=1 Tax=Rhizobium calliandrae TaxID=1312182 RepID=A0ABT7KKI8_9HYPH|nr:hypothetical protein [Rhizobium calliandrae]MDL2409152.1 hypothetical protein [Rhizobium calliandrae]